MCSLICPALYMSWAVAYSPLKCCPLTTGRLELASIWEVGSSLDWMAVIYLCLTGRRPRRSALRRALLHRLPATLQARQVQGAALRSVDKPFACVSAVRRHGHSTRGATPHVVLIRAVAMSECWIHSFTTANALPAGIQLGTRNLNPKSLGLRQ